jgi:transcriptional regulator with XRE-family HTH domain
MRVSTWLRASAMCPRGTPAAESSDAALWRSSCAGASGPGRRAWTGARCASGRGRARPEAHGRVPRHEVRGLRLSIASACSGVSARSLQRWIPSGQATCISRRCDSFLAIICPVSVTTLLRGPREAAGLSQRGLAKLARVPQPSIAELESGAQADATIGLVARLLDPCGSQLISVPTTTPTVAAASIELRDSARKGREGLLLRQLLQVNDDLAREEPATRIALCLTPPLLTGDARVDAFLAALCEYRLRGVRLPVPAWTSQPSRYCDPPWDVAGIPALVDDVRRSTPTPFRRHGVLISKEDLESV